MTAGRNKNSKTKVRKLQRMKAHERKVVALRKRRKRRNQQSRVARKWKAKFAAMEQQALAMPA